MWRRQPPATRRQPSSRTPPSSPSIAMPRRHPAQQSVLGAVGAGGATGRRLELRRAVITSRRPGFNKHHHPRWLEAHVPTKFPSPGRKVGVISVAKSRTGLHPASVIKLNDEQKPQKQQQKRVHLMDGPPSIAREDRKSTRLNSSHAD